MAPLLQWKWFVLYAPPSLLQSVLQMGLDGGTKISRCELCFAVTNNVVPELTSGGFMCAGLMCCVGLLGN